MRRPLDRLKKKVLLENLWIIILKMLKERKMIGYEIRNEVKKSYGFWCGNVTGYKVLYQLESGGYVKRDERKRYFITEKGKQELREGEKFLIGLGSK